MQLNGGATLGDIGYAIQSVAHREGYSIVREYCGHGIGKVYHEQPNILHYGQRGQGLVLKKGWSLQLNLWLMQANLR